MKSNKARADKIIKTFKAKFPLFTVLNIWDCSEGTIIKASKNPEQFKMGMPFYQLVGDVVINANPLSRADWFKEVVTEDNMIYRNTDIEMTNFKKKKSKEETQ